MKVLLIKEQIASGYYLPLIDSIIPYCNVLGYNYWSIEPDISLEFITEGQKFLFTKMLILRKSPNSITGHYKSGRRYAIPLVDFQSIR